MFPMLRKALDNFLVSGKVLSQNLKQVIPSRLQLRVFWDDFRVLQTELKEYAQLQYRIYRLKSVPRVVSSANLHELRLLRQVPRELLYLTPVFIVVAFPGTVLLLPICFAYPHVFLNRYFWDDKQRIQHDERSMNSRLSQSFTHFHCLKDHAALVRKEHSGSDIQCLESLTNLCEKALNRGPLSTEQLVETIPFFQKHLSLEQLSSVQSYQLCRLHDLFVRKRLSPCAHFEWMRLQYEPSFLHSRRINLLRVRSSILQAEDRILNKPGQLKRLTPTTILQLCFIRGIQASNESSAVETLRKWVDVSLQDKDVNSTFRLYLPVFFYNTMRPLHQS